MDESTLITVLTQIGLSETFAGRAAWKAQELVKGKSSVASFLVERSQGGWGLHGDYEDGDDIKTTPRFRPFLEDDLHDVDATKASTKAAQSNPNVRFDLLARGLPSLSYAAAVDEIPSFIDVAQNENRNFDMQIKGRDPDEWPTEDHQGEGIEGNWLHSDFRNVALPYLDEMYEEMISLGGLDE